MKKITAIIAFTMLISAANAQDLLTPTFSFSHKKTAYITLLDGTEISGNIKDLDRDKGVVEEVKIKDGSGKKHKFDADEISFMYLPPSGLDNLGKKMNFLTVVDNWNDEKLNQDFLNRGYAYFELRDVKIKKKTKKLLVQLLNPGFSKEVKIYHDPFAKKTMSLGVGSLKVAGGIAKSYYVAKGDAAAFRLKKKDYNEEFVPLWGSCDKVKETYTDPVWRDLAKHAITFSECTE